MEKNRAQLNFAEIQIEGEKIRLKRLANWVPRIYFATNIRQEQVREEYQELQPALCRKITAILNETLTTGGEVAIIDFPYPVNQLTNRVQIVTRHWYLRQVNAAIPAVRAFEWGYFSVRLTKIEHPNVKGGLSCSIFGNLRPFYTVGWNEEEAKFRRFIILTKEDKNLKLILDFNLEGTPAWKVNTEVFI